jgi:hypothetical protein
MIDADDLEAWIIELDMAAEGLMGIAGAIQKNDLRGRQSQCYRIKDRLILVGKAIRATAPESHNATPTQHETATPAEKPHETDSYCA